MTYDDFASKLRQIKAEFLRQHGRPIETVAELEETLASRLLKPRKRGAKSLGGLFR